MAKEFNTISDIISDVDFQNNVKNTLNDILKKREERPILMHGEYKRDWYDRGRDAGIFTPKFFIENIGLIWIKKSKLNAEFRHLILSVCNTALQNTMLDSKYMNNASE